MQLERTTGVLYVEELEPISENLACAGCAFANLHHKARLPGSPSQVGKQHLVNEFSYFNEVRVCQ